MSPHRRATHVQRMTTQAPAQGISHGVDSGCQIWPGPREVLGNCEAIERKTRDVGTGLGKYTAGESSRRMILLGMHSKQLLIRSLCPDESLVAGKLRRWCHRGVRRSRESAKSFTYGLQSNQTGPVPKLAEEEK